MVRLMSVCVRVFGVPQKKDIQCKFQINTSVTTLNKVSDEFIESVDNTNGKIVECLRKGV